ncbi:MAG: PTS transporter subunit EIIA [Piscirickettsiaceae bacterium]|jgi:nitrogen PTS system EIIA component|nr:PTS transporter subunit EIIA [Piscirickettsiaceae bacterium]
MLIASLLVNADNIHCNENAISSKKRLIENLSQYLATNTQALPANRIFQALLERERLGSTGLGRGVAIPHARVPGITDTIAVLMTLATPINYEAADNLPVDIVFGLLVPEDGDEYHLEHLARLATLLRDQATCENIRTTQDPEKLFNLLLAIDDD